MNNLSERVQREFNEWKEKYEIPHHMEFQVKTLLKLQEEYDTVETGSNTTKTRETLLYMIQNLQSRISLSEKTKTVMYVDYARNENQELNKVIAYVNTEIYVIKNGDSKDAIYFANIIKQIAKAKCAAIHIDTHGFGMGIYDELMKDSSLCVKKLQLIKNYMW